MKMEESEFSTVLFWLNYQGTPFCLTEAESSNYVRNEGIKDEKRASFITSVIKHYYSYY